MKNSTALDIAALVLVAIAVISCGSPAAPATSVPPTVTLAPATATSVPATSAPTTFTDPFAYCAAVVNVDQPDASYTGPKVPDSIVNALKKATGASADMPAQLFQNGSFWRCMDGKVYGCFVGANIPCQSKGDTSKVATDAEKQFCTQQPNADVIPDAVTGGETVYEWRCTNGAPEIVKQVLQVDARGYPTQWWYALTAQ